MSKRYRYYNTGLDWLGEVPDHWKLISLKNAFYIIPSNVDKKTGDDEIEVQLCNYVDVYYNDFINLSVDFMAATATEAEIKKFQLEVEDVLITKDSEDPFDIAVPALVAEVKDKLLCGYHLSLLRSSNKKVNGPYLFWALKDEVIATQLWREACGVTRWAIASRHIKNSIIPLPPKEEQSAIANYLKKACADIDRVIELKEKQITTLENNAKQTLIYLITKGVGKPKLKPAEVEWLAEVPEHWQKDKLFRVAKQIASGGTPQSGNEDYYGEDIYWVQSGDLNDSLITNTEKKITEIGLRNSSAKIFPSDTLLVAMYGATIGKLGILTMEAATNQACCAIIPTSKIKVKFLFYFFQAVKEKLIGDAYGGGQPNISQELIKQLHIYYPKSLKEQDLIISAIEREIQKNTKTQSIIKEQIYVLHTKKKSFIHEVVTGKKQIYFGADRKMVSKSKSELTEVA